jgi:ubiquitin-activating enzyme E1
MTPSDLLNIFVD